MSAFMTSDKHRNAMLNYLRLTAHRDYNELIIYLNDRPPVFLGNWHEDGTWIKAAKILYDENNRSLKARYQASNGPDFNSLSYVFSRGEKLSAVECLKACDCYDYQSCETENYKKSVAYALVEQTRDCATDHLPGYDKAKWEIR